MDQAKSKEFLLFWTLQEEQDRSFSSLPKPFRQKLPGMNLYWIKAMQMCLERYHKYSNEEYINSMKKIPLDEL